MHSCKAKFRAGADTPPDALFTQGEVGEAFADERKARVCCHVDRGRTAEDLYQDLGGNGGNWAWRSRGAFDRRRSPFYQERVERLDELRSSGSWLWGPVEGVMGGVGNGDRRIGWIRVGRFREE